MVKYFCDECGEEVSIKKAVFTLDMIGKVLCDKHKEEYNKMHSKHIYSKTGDNGSVTVFGIDQK